MAQSTINPFGGLEAQYTAALDSAVAAPASIASMNTAIIGSLVPIYYVGAPPDAMNFITPELNAVLANSENGFINSAIRSGAIGYSSQQLSFVNDLINGVMNVPIQSIKDFILDIEDNISKSGMSPGEQAPLLQATMVGAAAYDYWIAKIIAPGAWGPFFDQNAANSAYNRMNVPYWVSTSMEGALIASSGYGFIDPPRTIGNNIVSVLAGSAGVMAGKVIFKWIQRYQNSPTPSLSLQTVARLTDTSRGGGGKEELLYPGPNAPIGLAILMWTRPDVLHLQVV